MAIERNDSQFRRIAGEFYAGDIPIFVQGDIKGSGDTIFDIEGHHLDFGIFLSCNWIFVVVCARIGIKLTTCGV